MNIQTCVSCSNGLIALTLEKKKILKGYEKKIKKFEIYFNPVRNFILRESNAFNPKDKDVLSLNMHKVS